MTVDRNRAFPNTLAVASTATFVVKIKSKTEISELEDLVAKENLPIFVIGEGSNIVPHDHVEGIVVILDLKGIEIDGNKLQIQAGEKWDDVVKTAVANDLSGIEALSWIPGKAGSAPIQNIGAYGSEISDCLENVEVYDREKKKFYTLNKTECEFGYRNSLFKKHPNRFIIISIVLKLLKAGAQMPKYKDIQEYFSDKKDTPNLKEIREAIIIIREKKLPDPNIIPNAGSYFTNPILAESKVMALKKSFPEIPLFHFADKTKIPAGWLLEKAGLKGVKIGKVQVSPNNALVLTNPEKANFAEIIEAENFIRQKVFEKFDIILEREPRII